MYFAIISFSFIAFSFSAFNSSAFKAASVVVLITFTVKLKKLLESMNAGRGAANVLVNNESALIKKLALSPTVNKVKPSIKSPLKDAFAIFN